MLILTVKSYKNNVVMLTFELAAAAAAVVAAAEVFSLLSA